MSEEVYPANAVSPVSSVSLDHLIGLCDEISALVKAGLPIESALANTSSRGRSKIAAHLKKLGEQLGTGKSLADTLRDDPAFPPVYAAVVEAGIRSNDLPGALDSIARNARTLRETRLFLIRMSMYPMMLFTLLWIIFVAIFFLVGPRFAAFFENFGAETFTLGLMKWTATTGRVLTIMFEAPFILWVLFAIWAVRSARGTMIQSSYSRPIIGWIPWIGKAATQLQKESFAQICAMLLRASLPLDEVLLLAAKATNDRYWSKKSQQQLRDSVIQKNVEKYPSSPISPLIRWAVGIPKQELLVEGMEQYARISRSRALALISKCELFLPTILVFVCAVSVAACYVLAIFWPYTQLLNHLSGITY